MVFGKIIGYYPHKFKIENSLQKLLPVQKVGFQETLTIADPSSKPEADTY